MLKSVMWIIVAGQLLLSCVAAQEPPALSMVPTTTGLGTIEGTVIYASDRARPWRYRRYYVKGRDRGPLAEAVVCLVGDNVPKVESAPKALPYVVDQKDYRFIPETLAIRVGQAVRFGNSDPTLHDVTTTAGTQQASIALYQNQPNERTFTAAGGIERPVKLSCRFHSEMRGWIFVFDHPWYQVTEPDGKFALQNVPPGQYRLVMFHPAGELRVEQEVEVRPNMPTRLEIAVSPDHVLAAQQ